MGRVIEGFRLSPQQRYLWAACRDGIAPVSQCRVTLSGELEQARVVGALEELAGIHESLRTRFESLPGMEIPVQVIDDELTVDVRRVDLTDRPAKERSVALDRRTRQERREPFDVENGPLVRFTLVRLRDVEHALLITAHPLCADGTSLENLAKELAGLLAGTEIEREPLQYVQYAEWLNEVLEEPDEEERAGLEFWERTDLAVGEHLVLPLESRVEEPSARRHLESVSGTLGTDAAERLDWVAADQGGSARSLLLSCWGLLLLRLCGRREGAVEVRFEGRKFEELDGAVGLFERDVPVVVRIAAGGRFNGLLRRLEGRLTELQRHEELFVHPDSPERWAGVGFSLDDRPAPERLGDLRVALDERVCHAAPLKLVLAAIRDAGEVRFELHYDPLRFDRAEAGRLLERVLTLTEGAIEQPEAELAALPILGPSERQLLDARSGRAADAPDEPDLQRMLASLVEGEPETLSVIAEDRELTAAELLASARRLAATLRQLGAGPESRVGLFLGRSARLLEALFGVLEAGAAWVPIEPQQPEERIERMLRDAEPVAVITERELRERIPDDLPGIICLDDETEPDRTVDLDGPGSGSYGGAGSLAYLLYTSGTTGRPKAVAVERRSVTNLLTALDRAVYRDFEDSGSLRVSLNAPLTFDASVKQWIQLLRGHAVAVIPEAVRADGEALIEWLTAHRVDVFDCTPSQLRLLLEAGLEDPARAPDHPRVVLVGGEPLDPDLWDRLASGRRRYYNLYGPTECTGDTTATPLVQGIRPVIGQPLLNVAARVLDGSLRQVPIGAAGELCVSGAGVARGYAGRPAQTAASFVPDPFGDEPGRRLYRTGDRVRFLGDGGLEFLGRLDRQVKVRGTRVELAEIESVLAAHPAVRSAVVDLRDGERMGGSLAAYVVPTTRPAADPPDEGLRHMLPNGRSVVALDRSETDYMYREIFEERSYLTDGLELDPGAVVFDVGANIGLFSLFAAQESPGAVIYAFEPIRPIYGILEHNAGVHFPGARLFQFGLSSEEATVPFRFYPRFAARSGFEAYADRENELEVTRRYVERLRREGDEGLDEIGGEMDELLAGKLSSVREEGRVRRLSDVIREEEVDTIDLLKIDVQRAELDVLRGIDEEDWGRIRQIAMEVHDEPDTPTEGRLGEIRTLLRDHGFRVSTFQEEVLEGTDRHFLVARSRTEGTKRSTTGSGVEVSPREVETAAAEAVAAEEVDLRETTLRDYLRERLPEFMIPAAFVVLEDLPYNRSGKVDLQALPDPAEVRSADGGQVEEPRTPVEEILVGLFREILGRERVGVDESFFALGGHSLLATQLMSRVRSAFEIELPLRLLFERPTARALAARVEAGRRGEIGREAPAFEPVPREDRAMLSFAQQRLWFVHRLEPESPAYNSAKAIRLRGALDLELVRATLDTIVRRHEVLRTVFPEIDGDPVQQILPPRRLELPVVELASLPEEERVEQTTRQVGLQRRQPFDLTAEPAVRVRVFRLGPEDHVVLFILHHIAGDAWSMAVLIQEVQQAYGALSLGKTPELPELPIQYADFAQRQRRWLQGEVLEDHMSFWRRHLAGAPTLMPLPSEESMGPGPDPGDVRSASRIPDGVAAELRALSQRHGTTLFMTLLAAFYILLQRSIGRDDLVVGTGVAGRNRAEIEGLIGFFINMLPLRVDLSDRPTFLELLQRVREIALDAYTHQELPFEKLVEELRVERPPGRNPLFQIFFGLQNAPGGSLELPGVELESFSVGGGDSRLDLSVYMEELGDGHGLIGQWTFDERLIPDSVVGRLQHRFATLLASITANPERRIDELAILTQEERELQQSRHQAAKKSSREKFMKSHGASAG